MSKIATPQGVTLGRELRGNHWYVVMHIHDGGTLMFPTDKAHQICREIMVQVGEIDKLVRNGAGQKWPLVHRPR